MENLRSKKLDTPKTDVKSKEKSKIAIPFNTADVKKQLAEQIILKSAYDCLIDDFNSLELKINALIHEQDKVSGRVTEIEIRNKPDSNIYAGINAILQYKKTHRDLKEKAEKEFDDNTK